MHEGLESTLLILGHRFKGNAHHPAIKLVKEYGDLPLVECFPSEINQVFMNLISNAIDAIEEANKNKDIDTISRNSGVIKIKTEVIGEQVILRVADNGSGIKNADTTKIFDAFTQQNLSVKEQGLVYLLLTKLWLITIMASSHTIPSQVKV